MENLLCSVAIVSVVHPVVAPVFLEFLSSHPRIVAVAQLPTLYSLIAIVLSLVVSSYLIAAILLQCP